MLVRLAISAGETPRPLQESTTMTTPLVSRRPLFLPRRRPGPRAARPGVEPLESRLVPSANLAPNPTMTGPSGWLYYRGAVHDATVSRDSGTNNGSARISVDNSEICSNFVAVTPGTTYTLSGFLKTSLFSEMGFVQVAVYDANHAFKYNVQGSYQATTQANAWQEVGMVYTAQGGDAYVRLDFGRLPAGEGPIDTGGMWIDDVYFGQGVGFQDPPSAKTAFTGSMVQVDASGNFQVLQNNAWQAFFPFTVYRSSVNTLQTYSNQGFNTLINSLSVDLLSQGAQAVSGYNPHGLMSWMDISPYIDPRSNLYDNLSDLTANLVAVEASPYLDHVLGFYWDNEQYGGNYSVAQAVTNLVKQYDVDPNTGQRLHPIYMNNANQGADRLYAGMVDVVGDYLRSRVTDPYLGPQQSTINRFAAANDLEGQTDPASIGIISEEYYGSRVGLLAYEAFIAGVRGISYYKDGGHTSNYDGNPNGPGANNITQRDAWPEFATLATQIGQLMPLLETPLGTSWQLSSTNWKVEYGTRDYNGSGYIILANADGQAQTAQLTFSGLGYTPSAVDDYFTGDPVATLSGSSFTLTLQPYQTMVVYLAP
jgi:hypothetical protein